MSNELVQSGGAIAPYQPASGLPASSTPLGGSVDYLSDHSSSGHQTLFGHALNLPAGATQEHMELAQQQITLVYKSDAKQLGITKSFADQAANWFKQAAFNSTNESPNHSYDLSNLSLPPGDAGPINAFCNWAQSIGASQEDTRRSLYWYSLLVAKVDQAQQAQQAQPQSQAQTPMAGKPVEKVSESEYRSILKNQDQAILNCQQKLKDLWGQSYQVKLNIAINYFRNTLTVEEQNHLQSAVIGNTMALNNPEVIRRMYMLATSGDQSQGLQSLQSEREAIENMIRINRRKYNNSPEIQSRYREIIDAMGG